MSNGAMHSRKTKFEIKDGDNWIQVKGLKDFSGLGGGAAAVVAVSDLDSDAVEKLFGLPDEGTFSANFNLIENDPGQLELEAARIASEVREFRLVLRNNKAFGFTGGVLTFDKSGGVDAALAASTTIEISGLVTRSTVV